MSLLINDVLSFLLQRLFAFAFKLKCKSIHIFVAFNLLEVGVLYQTEKLMVCAIRSSYDIDLDLLFVFFLLDCFINLVNFGSIRLLIKFLTLSKFW